ncbi:MAG: deoxynucleoside kinase [Rhodocyclaceae bacterium]
MLDKARYIVVEGPIGVGKTSFARRLGAALHADLLLERPEENPFLPRFYDNVERYALPAQLFFLLQRMDLVRSPTLLGSVENRVVSDFLLDRDPLFAALNLTEPEFALYQDLFNRLKPQSPTPDLVIYLQAGPETLLERVRRRHVESERRIGESYLSRVAERYASFFHQYDKAPLFIINADTLNPVDEDADFKLLLDRLQAMRSYREFFGYA